jgi:hypothetical protein
VATGDFGMSNRELLAFGRDASGCFTDRNEVEHNRLLRAAA